MQRCNCKSYNGEFGEIEEVVVKLPKRLQRDRSNNTVCLDACIAGIVQILWDNGYDSIGSCCGHNHEFPEIIVPTETKLNEIIEMFKLLSKIDNRKWLISRWEYILGKQYRVVYRQNRNNQYKYISRYIDLMCDLDIKKGM